MPRLIDILYSMAALGLALWVMTITTLAFGADYPLIACESDKIIVTIDQPECAHIATGGTVLGPVCQRYCDDPLDWAPPGQSLRITLDISAEYP